MPNAKVYISQTMYFLRETSVGVMMLSKSHMMVHFELKGNYNEKLVKDIETFAQKSKVKATIFGQEPTGKWKALGKEIQILMLLQDYKELKIPGYVPLNYTQEGISEKLALDRSVVSRHLSSLKEKKLVAVKTLNVIGENRKRKAYFLTIHGKGLLEEASSPKKKK